MLLLLLPLLLILLLLQCPEALLETEEVNLRAHLARADATELLVETLHHAGVSHQLRAKGRALVTGPQADAFHEWCRAALQH